MTPATAHAQAQVPLSSCNRCAGIDDDAVIGDSRPLALRGESASRELLRRQVRSKLTQQRDEPVTCAAANDDPVTKPTCDR